MRAIFIAEIPSSVWNVGSSERCSEVSAWLKKYMPCAVDDVCALNGSVIDEEKEKLIDEELSRLKTAGNPATNDRSAIIESYINNRAWGKEVRDAVRRVFADMPLEYMDDVKKIVFCARSVGHRSDIVASFEANHSVIIRIKNSDFAKIKHDAVRAIKKLTEPEREYPVKIHEDIVRIREHGELNEIIVGDVISNRLAYLLKAENATVAAFLTFLFTFIAFGVFSAARGGMDSLPSFVTPNSVWLVVAFLVSGLTLFARWVKIKGKTIIWRIPSE
jgi:hypothetical protein